MNQAAVADVWRAGCIIRASFLDRVRESFTAHPDLPGLLAHPSFAREVGAAQLPWRLVVSRATRDGVPVPAMAAALAHYDTLRAPRLPAALTQAQRDFFGAHTYRRNDRPGTFTPGGTWTVPRSSAASVRSLRSGRTQGSSSPSRAERGRAPTSRGPAGG
ncbi:hypothetical protein GCM10018789_60360 [Streptomyces werraensis]|nr:hypothetical protein GCM10018789_60360 [Streptomyces werraensis]